MKKLFALLMCSFAVFATPKDELSSRLALSDGFSAQFVQKVLSPDGELVSQGQGNVEIARPSLFRWETTSPDENLLVSDGKTVWYYSPFVEQVTIYDQAQATEQTPFILLTRNQKQDWDQYRVSQQGDEFTLVPVDEGRKGKFHIRIDGQGTVEGFDVIEQDGQQTQFIFQHIKQERPAKTNFTFKIPPGVEIDDQRH
ncbi:outer membrane lipoprotein chaperone LolA [Vibrio sp. PP-XX7]